jgi:hypothetical protein
VALTAVAVEPRGEVFQATPRVARSATKRKRLKPMRPQAPPAFGSHRIPDPRESVANHDDTKVGGQTPKKVTDPRCQENPRAALTVI